MESIDLGNRGLAFAMLASSSGRLRAPLSSSEIHSVSPVLRWFVFFFVIHHRSLYTIIVLNEMTLIITQIYSPK
jgi:hypothetical protein